MNIEDIGSPIADRGFGRLPALDHRDRKYLLRARLDVDAIAKAPKPYKYWWTGTARDQGNTPHCVAFAGSHFLEAGPVVNELGTPVVPTLENLYLECQDNDEWEGNQYDGTSVRALFKVLQRRGFVSEYSWAFQALDIAAWTLTRGPVVLGTDWYSGMMGDSAIAAKTDFISASGYPVGGHAYLIKGVNMAKACPDGTLGAFRLLNSWGRDWMSDGMAWISLADVQRLMSNWGEACTASEIRFEEVDQP